MSFSKAIPLILKHEGGYVHDKFDPGGETKYGISKRAYPNEDIKNLTEERAKLLYMKDYWKPLRCDSLPYGVAVCVFDFGVNSGTSRAVKALQSALGVKADGLIGPLTLEKANQLPEREIIEKITIERIAFYMSLTNWGRYGKGWLRRAIETMSHALT